ncbi:CAAX prenyl protease 1 like protein, partial [Dictyocoela roeselum]
LTFRQLIAIQKSEYNKFAKSVMSEKEFVTSKKYNTMKLIFSIFKELTETVKLYFYIHLLLIPRAYEAVNTHLIGKISNSPNSVQTIFMILLAHFEYIIGTPFDLFETFYIEQKFGFNTMTLKLFFIDFLKYVLVNSIIMYIPFQIILYTIDYCKNTFFLQLWGALLVLQILLIIVYPTFIQPLFNKFSELEDGSLKIKINKLAHSVGFNSDKIHVIDGSKRSHHSNAYFVGFFNIKRIVLFDTILKRENEDKTQGNKTNSTYKIGGVSMRNSGEDSKSGDTKNGEIKNGDAKNDESKNDESKNDESKKYKEAHILAILAHELGHWYHNHIYKLIGTQSIILLISLYFLESFIKIEIPYNGQDTPVLIKVFYFQLFISAINPLLALFMNFVSRKCEVEADKFACDKGYQQDLMAALLELHRENKANLNHDWMYSLFKHSHPTLSDRVAFIEAEMK